MLKDETLATAQTRLTVQTPEGSRTVDLYSPEGLRLVADLWVKVAAQHKVMYEPSWMGIPVIQFPEDMVAMQELVWRVRPDVLIECGVAHGGSLVLYASLMELMGKGRVIGVDVEIRKHNRVALENHPMSHRIQLIESDSTHPRLLEELKTRVRGAKTIMVVLDSNHSTRHVEREMELYSDLVTPGSYLVVMDGAQAQVWDIPRGKPEWRTDNPLAAIRAFLARRDDFEIDPHPTRTHITSNPDGYLRKRTPEETPVP